MSLRNLARFDRRIACEHGFYEIEGIYDCFNCNFSADCHILNDRNFYLQQDLYFQKLRAEDIEYRAIYYRDAQGVWNNSKFDGEGWKKVPKDKEIKNTPRKFACDSGNAFHPDFWKCEDCNLAPTCDIGQYRLKNFPQNNLNIFSSIFSSIKKIFFGE